MILWILINIGIAFSNDRNKNDVNKIFDEIQNIKKS